MVFFSEKLCGCLKRVELLDMETYKKGKRKQNTFVVWKLYFNWKNVKNECEWIVAVVCG